MQFEGRRQIAGVDRIVATLGGAVDELTIASWLTATNPALDGRRPIDALSTGDVESVVSLAQRFGTRMRQ